MKINNNNYELFLMDYLDGKLDANEVSEVLLFLEQNPDIKTEFEGIAEINIVDLQEAPMSFAHLKQKEFGQIKKGYEPLMVGALEGDLTTAERITLNTGFELYPELIQEQTLFAQTILQPDDAVIYPDKKSLKRGPVWVLHRNVMIRVAAVLLMAITAGWYFMDNKIVNPSYPPTTASLPLTKQPKKLHSIASTLPAAQPSNSHKENQQSLVKIHAANETLEQTMVVVNQTEVALIEPITSPMIIAKNPKVENDLNDVSEWLAYKQPQLPAKPEHTFTDLRTLAGIGINKGAQQLEARTQSVYEAMNKAVGVSVQKDETTGKIERFGIKGLGFEWSKSK